MKTKLLLRFCLPLFAALSLSFSDPYTIKRITDTSYKYEFYTTQKKITAKTGRQYYWFRGGAIHNAESGIAGEVLNELFIKMYLNNQLAEKGMFKNGLKTGIWKTWHPNGTVQTIQNWSNGLRKGKSQSFDNNGILLETGTYKQNLKHGLWIDAVKKDTVSYKKGNLFVKKIKPAKGQNANAKNADGTAKEGFFKRLFSTKELDAAREKAKGQPKKESFFKRLFSKKQAKTKTNG